MTPSETWVALVHYPVYDKHQKVVSTALTNLDLHDIARSTRTYNLAGYLIVHPVAAQRELCNRIGSHWLSEGAQMNDFRRMAIERVAVVADIEGAKAHITERTGRTPTLVSTSAQSGPGSVGYQALRASVDGPVLLLFGTGWGLTEDVLKDCQFRLRPIHPLLASDYNHLSVRSACAIVLDRLYGDRED